MKSIHLLTLLCAIVTAIVCCSANVLHGSEMMDARKVHASVSGLFNRQMNHNRPFHGDRQHGNRPSRNNRGRKLRRKGHMHHAPPKKDHDHKRKEDRTGSRHRSNSPHSHTKNRHQRNRGYQKENNALMSNRVYDGKTKLFILADDDYSNDDDNVFPKMNGHIISISEYDGGVDAGPSRSNKSGGRTHHVNKKRHQKWHKPPRGKSTQSKGKGIHGKRNHHVHKHSHKGNKGKGHQQKQKNRSHHNHRHKHCKGKGHRDTHQQHSKNGHKLTNGGAYSGVKTESATVSRQSKSGRSNESGSSSHKEDGYEYIGTKPKTNSKLVKSPTHQSKVVHAPSKRGTNLEAKALSKNDPKKSSKSHKK